MKIFFRIALWVLISILLQVSTLAYLDYFLHTEKNNFVAKKVKHHAKKAQIEEIRIDSANAANIKVSFDGTYVSYITEGSLHILDMHKKTEVALLSKPDEAVSFYKWLPDRNRMLILYKNKRFKRAAFDLYAYDVDNLTENSIQKFRKLPSSTEVSDLQLSTFTNMIYVHFRTKRGYAFIYRIDIMNRLRVVRPAIRYIDKIFEASHRDLLIYQSSQNKDYYILKDGRRYGKLDIAENLSLLGIDKDDRIYAGEFDQNGNITSIYKGKIRSRIETNKWKAIALPVPAKPEDVLFSYDQGIFIKTGKNELDRLSDNKKLKFNGDIIDILKDDLVFMDGNTLSVLSI